MRSDASHVLLRRRSAGVRLWKGSPLRAFGIVMVSIILLCGGLSCGRRGPLKPLKKEAPAYNFRQTGLALPDLYMIPE
jgi:hypothetical protein